jgi:hypothetical protein
MEGTSLHNAYNQRGNMKRLAYTEQVRPTPECRAVCWGRTEVGQRLKSGAIDSG